MSFYFGIVGIVLYASNVNQIEYNAMMNLSSALVREWLTKRVKWKSHQHMNNDWWGLGRWLLTVKRWNKGRKNERRIRKEWRETNREPSLKVINAHSWFYILTRLVVLSQWNCRIAVFCERTQAHRLFAPSTKTGHMTGISQLQSFWPPYWKNNTSTLI